MTSFLKTVALVNALLAVTFGIFAELCLLCVQANISPWLSVPGTIAICGFIYLKTLKVIVRRFG